MQYRVDYPIFESHPQMVYLDHAATAQKPNMVLERETAYYNSVNSSPHRGAYKLSIKSTELLNEGRQRMKSFVGAGDQYETVFTKNATEALNLIAMSYVMETISAGDEVCVSIDAHHSVIVPLQKAVKAKGAKLRYLYMDQTGEITVNPINEKTKVLALPWIGNSLGKIHNLAEIMGQAKRYDVRVIVDATQAVGHVEMNIDALGVDFLVFSGHKMYGPQGIGGLIGRKDLLETMPPFLMGGGMIEFVEEESAAFAEIPERFEAGTPNVAGVVGLIAALDYMEKVGVNQIEAYERSLIEYACERLEAIEDVSIIGPMNISKRGALITFNLGQIHPHDVASILDDQWIAIRAGHHCTQPLMKHLGISASCRLSVGLYNTRKDIDQLIQGLMKVKEVFGVF